MIVRRMDVLGRITIPKEMRDYLGMSVNEPLCITSKGDKVEIFKANNFKERFKNLTEELSIEEKRDLIKLLEEGL